MSPDTTKVTTRHLQRDAYLYVRQSTQRQVLENTESTHRQYALWERAVALGWRHIPERLRWVPDYVEARRRLDGRPRPDTLGRAVQQRILDGIKPQRAG